MGKIMYKDRQYSSSFDKSVNISYDNSNSGLNASNVQAAIDELKSMPVANHTHNYAASSSVGGDAKKAEVLSVFYLDSSQQKTSGYWNPYTFGLGTWGALAGTYAFYDSEGTGFNGIFSIKVRCDANGNALDGALSWLTANSTTPPVLTITYAYDSSQKKTVFRLYVTVGGGWRSYKLTKISEVGGSNVSHSSSIVTSMTGTTFLTASSIAVSSGSVGAHTHSEYALTSHTHSQYVTSGSVCTLGGIQLDSLGAYIYQQGTGNIYFRFRKTSTSDYSYVTVGELCDAINAKLPLSGGVVSGNLVSTKTFAALSSSDPQGTYYTANRIHCTNNSIFRISNTGNTEGVAIGENFRSSQNNTMNLGNSSYKWKQLYAGTTTINTSDRNSKEDFRTFDSNENYEKLFMDLKPLVFKFKDGDSGRDHFGFVSQDVEESLYKLGFNDKSFAGFCKDVLMHEVETEDGDTKEVPKLDENGNEQYIYGLRYGEFTAFNTWMIQKIIKENQELKDKNEKLEAKNEELESRLQAIENMLEKLNV